MDDLDLKLLSELRADAAEPDADRLRSLRARATARPRRFRLAPFRPVASIAAAAVVAVVAVGALGAVVVTGGDDQPAVRPGTGAAATPMDAEVTLERAALVAGRRAPSTAPRPDQWMYRKDVVTTGDGGNRVQEYWTRYDGTRQATRVDGGPLETRTAEPDPDDDDLTPRQYAARLAALPTDPARLLDHVRGDRHWAEKPKGEDGGKEHPDARAFRVLSVYLGQELPMPPKLEKAVFRALAMIPGVRVDTGVRDALGRPGVGIAYEDAVPGSGTARDEQGRAVARSYVILDPVTYRYLGMRMEHLEDEVLDGEVLARKGSFYATAEVAAGVVDEPGSLP